MTDKKWLKLTSEALYLMSGGCYLKKLGYTDNQENLSKIKLTPGKELAVSGIPKNWFNSLRNLVIYPNKDKELIEEIRDPDENGGWLLLTKNYLYLMAPDTRPENVYFEKLKVTVKDTKESVDSILESKIEEKHEPIIKKIPDDWFDFPRSLAIDFNTTSEPQKCT